MERKSIAISDNRMSYLEAGEGDPIVFLHGNPTSSELWRNIIPHLALLGRCIAPDLIGMGQSDKLSDESQGRYRFVEHRGYLEGFLDAVGVKENVTLVVHDWGSALGFDWAHRHPDAVSGIVYMEAIVRAMSWDDWPESAKPIFEALRSPAGEQMILEKNIFVEKILPASIIRELDADEMELYRAPFAEPGEDRRATLTWPREIPFDGSPSDVAEIVAAYSHWLEQSNVPKLFINADPGFILIGSQRDYCRTWPNQTEVTVPGIHFIQEDSPDEIGKAIVAWLSEKAPTA